MNHQPHLLLHRIHQSNGGWLLLLLGLLLAGGCSPDSRPGGGGSTEEEGDGAGDAATGDLGLVDLGGPGDSGRPDQGPPGEDGGSPPTDLGPADLGWQGDLGDLGDPCASHPCSEPHRGRCQVEGGQAVCRCDDGFAEQPPLGHCRPVCTAGIERCAAAVRSFDTLVSANGHGAVGFNLGNRRLSTFLVHPYQAWDEGIPSRDLLWDSYLGLRTENVHKWLSDVPLQGGEYLSESGMFRVVTLLDGLLVETLAWAPWQLSRPAVVLVGRVTNPTAEPRTLDLYTIHNYHLGHTTEADRVNPRADGEQVRTDEASQAYIEQGIGGTLVHWPLGEPTHRSCTPDNPYTLLNAGQPLTDRAAAEPGEDRVVGFSRTMTLAPGEQGLFGVVTAFDQGQDAATVLRELAAAYQGQDAAAALTEALQEWERWRRPPPPGLDPAELTIYRQQEAVLRMGQVWELSDRSRGQILASLPPGQWNIAWARDMAYSVAALARVGHLPEAREALRFYLEAESGLYARYLGGLDYQISVCRYFGRGKEESDANSDGPNVEFDGFGLFLWALGEYLRAGGEDDWLDDYWPVIRDEVAEALVALIDPATGLIAADSSIWEVHWNGKQKQYTYTSLAAARGLCDASRLAEARVDLVLAARWQTASLALRDAIRIRLVGPEGALASSLEELTAGQGYRDAAVVEAIGWQLIDPQGELATRTLAAFDRDLRTANGFGYFRNDDGGWYDQQEWVFIDLRTAVARRLAGQPADADALIAWITAQAQANFSLIAELHHPQLGTYEGAIPMVGFGAGAYLLALWDRADPPAPGFECGGWE